ncbi:MAG: haloacid dehalogenase-like hydrolase [Ruminococcus sp.]|nr:haloacid dehalogenase-like hydrolase [Ruminococcus sp.]
MNVYDFDRTIYNGDSTVDFYLFCMWRHKRILLLLPSLLFAYIKYYLFNIGTKTEFKESMYKFLKFCNAETDVADFWKEHISKIKHWYLEQRKDDDVIISASPEFLLNPCGKEIGFTVIASKVCSKSGKYDGENCYYNEKVNRFFQLYPDSVIDEFYSDHYSDEPLANISKKAFIVDKDTIIPWDFNKHIKPHI